MEPVGYRENLSMLRTLFPDKLVISLNECASVLGVDTRTVRNMSRRVKDPLPTICLSQSKKSRYGVSLPSLARWITVQGIK